MVPREVGGVRTDVMQVGIIRALAGRAERWRPAPPGVSIGHFQITAGTLGAVVRDRDTGQPLILSNNHVLANGNEAKLGDPILQPGTVDGGMIEEDTLAHLERFHPIKFGVEPASCDLADLYARTSNALAHLVGSRHRVQILKTDPLAVNLVDAALALPIEPGAISNTILEIGEILGVTAAGLGMLVRKSGRTTGISTGEVLVLDTTIQVSYGAGRSATFEEQIITSPMSQGGDSGALLVGADNLFAVGLLFAGSSETTVYNPIQAVLDCLNVEFASESAVNKRVNRDATIKRAQAIREAYQGMLMKKANVVGVGVGLLHRGGGRTDTIGLIVMVRQKVPRKLLSSEDIIPSEIEGIPVDVKEVGEIEPH
jgi:hypothetical protein